MSHIKQLAMTAALSIAIIGAVVVGNAGQGTGHAGAAGLEQSRPTAAAVIERITSPAEAPALAPATFGWCPGSAYYCLTTIYVGTDICNAVQTWYGAIVSIWNCRPSGYSQLRPAAATE